MKVKVFQTESGMWRADPMQLPGCPPNGTGETSGDAIASLRMRLANISPDGPDKGFIPIMRKHGWPCIEVVEE